MNGTSSVSGVRTEAFIHEIEFNFWETWAEGKIVNGPNGKPVYIHAAARTMNAEEVGQVIYNAATDGTDQLRYLIGDDSRASSRPGEKCRNRITLIS